MVGNSICGKLLSDIFPNTKIMLTQKQGRQVVKYDKPMFTSLVEKK